MRSFIYLLAAGLVWLSFDACKTTEDNFNTDLGHSYMALEVGHFVEYQVDSSIYDPTGDSTVSFSHSYLRDIIVDTLRDNIGNLLFRTERFVRKDTFENWEILKVFTQSIQGNQGIKTIDNLRYIKLAFPLQQFNSWDPLVHIDKSTQFIVAGETLEPFRNNVWRSRILSVNEPDTVGTLKYDEVLNLQEVDTDGESTIDLRISTEKYARDVGLIYKEQWILDTEKCQQECNPLEIAYNSCYEPCYSNCLAAGTTDSLQCDENCINECITPFINFINCRDTCEALPWVDRATKGYIMTMSVVNHN